VISVYRTVRVRVDDPNSLRQPVPRTGSGEFDDDEITFVRSVAGVLGVATERMRAERDIRFQALHDALTGLPNRASLLGRLERAVGGATRTDGRIGVLFVDLDGFKAVNDSLGHQAGDEVLRSVASRLREAVRPGDIVARLSGDEFAIMCEGVTAVRDLEAIADRVVRLVGAPVVIAGHPVRIGASVGIALSDGALTDADRILRAADNAMYGAKRRGRGCYLVSEETSA
jgi:diguanylate cyclase (GGDEF)-like protein